MAKVRLLAQAADVSDGEYITILERRLQDAESSVKSLREVVRAHEDWADRVGYPKSLLVADDIISATNLKNTLTKEFFNQLPLSLRAKKGIVLEASELLTSWRVQPSALIENIVNGVSGKLEELAFLTEDE